MMADTDNAEGNRVEVVASVVPVVPEGGSKDTHTVNVGSQPVTNSSHGHEDGVNDSSRVVNAGSQNTTPLDKVSKKIQVITESLSARPRALAKKAEKQRTEEEIVKAMVIANATNEDIADYLGIGLTTLKHRYSELIRTAKRDMVAKIGGQLANMALGYRIIEDPDTGERIKLPVEEKTQVSAAQFYQARVGRWVEKQEHEVSGPDGAPIVSAHLQGLEDSTLETILSALIAQKKPKALEVSTETA